MSAGMLAVYAQHVRDHGCGCEDCHKRLDELFPISMALPIDDLRVYIQHVTRMALNHGCVCSECSRWLKAAQEQELYGFAS